MNFARSHQILVNGLDRLFSQRKAAVGALAMSFALGMAPAQADEAADVVRLTKAGQFNEALSVADGVLAKKPRDAQMRFLKGVTLAKNNRPADAIAIFTKLTEEFPAMPEPYNNLAVLYAASGQYEKARITLDKAIRSNPAYSTAFDNLGNVHARLASQAYDKALQNDSRSKESAMQLALVPDLGNAGVQPNTAAKAAAPAATASAPATTPGKVVMAPAAPLTPAAAPAAAKPAAPSAVPSTAAVTATAPAKPAATVASAAPGHTTATHTPASAPTPSSTPAPVPAKPAAPVASTTAPAAPATPVVSAAAARAKAREDARLAQVAAREAAKEEARLKARQKAEEEEKREARVAAENAPVLSAVNGWAREWSARDVNGYLSYYSPEFDTPAGMSRKAWADERRARIVGKAHIEVKVESPEVRIDGNLATVTYRQTYVSDRLTVRSRKTLVLARQKNGKWLIQQERSGS